MLENNRYKLYLKVHCAYVSWILLFGGMLLWSYLSESYGYPVIGVISIISFLFIINLYRINIVEGRLSIKNISVIFVSITYIYIIFPLIGFYLDDFSWGLLSDQRLRKYSPTPVQLSEFYNYVIAYFIGITFACLIVGKTQIENRILLNTNKAEGYSLILIWLICNFISFLGAFNMFAETHLYSQIRNIASMIELQSLIGIFIVAVSRKSNKLYLVLASALLAYQLFLVLTLQSGRTFLAMLLIACLLVYGLYVRRLKIIEVATFSFGLFLFLLFWGYLRHGLLTDALYFGFFSSTNEFTSILGTSYDLFKRLIVEGQKIDIPTTVLYNDLFLSIPSQFLPYYKWSTSEWYLELLGLRGTGVGMMFGVISQGIVGGGIIELFIRGFLTFLIFHFLLKVFVRNSSNILYGIIYIFMAVKCYYSYRAGSGYILYFILYNVIPFFFAFAIARVLVKSCVLPRNDVHKCVG